MFVSDASNIARTRARAEMLSTETQTAMCKTPMSKPFKKYMSHPLLPLADSCPQNPTPT